MADTSWSLHSVRGLLKWNRLSDHSHGQHLPSDNVSQLPCTAHSSGSNTAEVKKLFYWPCRWFLVCHLVLKNCSTCRAPEKCGMLLNEFESAEKDVTFLFSSTLSLTKVWVGCFAAFLENCWMLPRQPNWPWRGCVFIMKTESVEKPCWCRFTNFYFIFLFSHRYTTYLTQVHRPVDIFM